MSKQRGTRSRRVAQVVAVLGVAAAASVVGIAPATAASAAVAGTPCTIGARACVDLLSQQAWLVDPAGKVTRGPIPVATGGLGKETPLGTFKVIWKDKDHKSSEYKTPQGLPAPMPWSVFFAEGGIAFHGGTLRRASAGCVRLEDPDAQVFFNTLQVGDQVQVRNGSDAGADAERAAAVAPPADTARTRAEPATTVARRTTPSSDADSDGGAGQAPDDPSPRSRADQPTPPAASAAQPKPPAREHRNNPERRSPLDGALPRGL